MYLRLPVPVFVLLLGKRWRIWASDHLVHLQNAHASWLFLRATCATPRHLDIDLNVSIVSAASKILFWHILFNFFWCPCGSVSFSGYRN